MLPLGSWYVLGAQFCLLTNTQVLKKFAGCLCPHDKNPIPISGMDQHIVTSQLQTVGVATVAFSVPNENTTY